MYINSFGVIYEGDMQYGDREATQTEIKSNMFKKELAALTAAYKADNESLKSGYLSVVVADGTVEDANKATVVASVNARKSQWQTDLNALKARYA